MATDRVELAKGGTSDDSIFVSSTFKDMFGEWFGYADEKERTAKQSQVYIRESLIRGGTELEMVRNKIDRFSGGMAEGSLYRERSYFEGNYKLNFNIMNGLEELNDGQKVFFSYEKVLVTIKLKNGRTKTIPQFKVTDISKQKRNKLKEGFLIKGEPGPSGLKNEKSNYIVISPQPVTASRGNAKTVFVS